MPIEEFKHPTLERKFSKKQEASQEKAKHIKISEEIYFIDIDYNFIACPIEVVIYSLSQRVSKKLSNLLQIKTQLLQNIEKPILQEDVLKAAYNLGNAIGLIAMKKQIDRQVDAIKDSLQNSSSLNRMVTTKK